MALPAMVAGILQAGIVWGISKLVVKLLVAFGVGFVTYKGIDTLLTMAQGYIDANIGGLPSTVLQLCHTMNIFAAINMIVSAISIRYTVLWSGRKLVFNTPAP